LASHLAAVHLQSKVHSVWETVRHIILKLAQSFVFQLILSALLNATDLIDGTF